MLVDGYGRTVQYIRVSVTDRCNLRCRYCMPEDGVPLLSHQDVLRFEEIEAFVRVAVEAGVRSVRLTGGEPLVKKGIVGLVRLLAAIPGVEDLSLTTNGILLEPLARRLREAGLKRVNVGLPSLDPETHARVSRGSRDLAKLALRGITAAVQAGLDPVKLNVVVMRAVNEDPAAWLDLIQTAPVHVRFIEYMPMGPEPSAHLYVPAAWIEKRLKALAGPTWHPAGECTGSGPARRTFRVGTSAGTVSFITPMSEHFCASCNRLRLTADGHLRPCLFSDAEIDIRPALRPSVDRERLRELLHAAVRTKPECLQVAPNRARMMGQIGG